MGAGRPTSQSFGGYTSRGNVRTACRGRHRKASQTAGLKGQRWACSPLEEEDQGWLLPGPPSWAWRWPPSPCVSLTELYLHSDGKKSATAAGPRVAGGPGVLVSAGRRRRGTRALRVPPHVPKIRKASLRSRRSGLAAVTLEAGGECGGLGGPSGVPTTFRFLVWALLSGPPSAGENHWAVLCRRAHS